VDQAAVVCTFVSIKTLADGSPRIVLQADCSLSELAALGLTPGAPFALARMTQEAANPATVKQSLTVEQKAPVGPLCKLAVQFCADPMFIRWTAKSLDDAFGACEETAKQFVLETCNIESRKELDTNVQAGAAFHKHIRLPFMAWRDSQARAA
jgi:hypothetical protein